MRQDDTRDTALAAYLMQRRSVLRFGAAAATAATLPWVSAPAQAKPATAMHFVGWQYHPDIAAENVATFAKLYDENVDYQLVAGEYQALVETMLIAGKNFDMLYSEEATLARWIAGGWARDVESMPDVAAIKESIVPVGVRNLSMPDGKLGGLPYYAGHIAFVVNEAHLDQAKLEPPTTWEQMLDQSRKLKRDKIAEFPYVSAWQHTWASLSWSIFAIWYSEGARVFDDKYEPVFDDKFKSVLELHRTLYKEGLVQPDIFTLPEESVPSFATGQHSFMPLHDYDQKVLNDPKLSQCAGKVKTVLMPGATHSTFSWASLYLMGGKPVDAERVWNLMRFFGGKAKDGQYHVIKRWALEFGLGTPYKEMLDDPEIINSYKQWKDVDLSRHQLEISTPRDVAKTLWFSDWDWYMMGALQDYIRGDQATDALVDDLRKQVGVMKARYPG